MQVLLQVTDLSCGYGPVLAVRDISFGIAEGSLACILGANGAGKSTTLKAVSGLVRPVGGHIVFGGRDITRLPPSRRVDPGISHCPEGRRIFASLTVLENLRLGGHRLGRAELGFAVERAVSVFAALQRGTRGIYCFIARFQRTGRKQRPQNGAAQQALAHRRDARVQRAGQCRVPFGIAIERVGQLQVADADLVQVQVLAALVIPQ